MTGRQQGLAVLVFAGSLMFSALWVGTAEPGWEAATDATHCPAPAGNTISAIMLMDTSALPLDHRTDVVGAPEDLQEAPY